MRSIRRHHRKRLMENRSKLHWGVPLWNYIHTITIVDFIEDNVNIHVSNNIYEFLKTIKFIFVTTQI